MPILGAEDCVCMAFYEIFETFCLFVHDLYIIAIGHNNKVSFAILALPFKLAILNINNLIIEPNNNALKFQFDSIFIFIFLGP